MKALFVSLFCICTLLLVSVVHQVHAAEAVQLQHAAHICNDETETQRLAANDQLREMAKALVEFKATKYCFIMQPTTVVTLLEHKGTYIKFSHNNKILYAFADDLVSQQAATQDMGAQAAIE